MNPKTAIMGIIVVIGALNTPVIPESMELQYSYQMRPSQYQEYMPDEIVYGTSSSTPDQHVKVKNPDIFFADTDGDDIVSVSVFKSRDGNTVYQQITESKYTEIGQKDGYSKNPTKTELISIMKAMTDPTPVEAAITRGTYARLSTWGSRSSLTAAYTVNGNFLVVFDTWFKNETGPTATYNGVAMDISVKQAQSADALRVTSFTLKSPSTGSNNVVITYPSTDWNQSGAVDFGEADTTTNPPNWGTFLHATCPSPLTISTTTAATDSFPIAALYLNNAGVPRAGTTELEDNSELAVYVSTVSTTTSPVLVALTNPANKGCHGVIIVVQGETTPPPASPNDNIILFE